LPASARPPYLCPWSVRFWVRGSQLRFLCVSIARRPRPGANSEFLIEELRRRIFCPRLSAAPRAVSSHIVTFRRQRVLLLARLSSLKARHPTCFLDARRWLMGDGGSRVEDFLQNPRVEGFFKPSTRSTGGRQHGSVSLHPPLQATTHAYHRCARQRGPSLRRCASVRWDYFSSSRR
jgi:hypothetical protein